MRVLVPHDVLRIVDMYSIVIAIQHLATHANICTGIFTPASDRGQVTMPRSWLVISQEQVEALS